MDLAATRSFFLGTRDRVFLDAACISLLPVQAEAALHQLSQDMLYCPPGDASAHHIALDRTADQPRREVARLIGARPDDVALVESTTQGLEIVAATVPLQRGDKVLVGDTEFLGLAVPWVPRQQGDGFHLEVVPHRDGRLCVDDFARAVDDRTRLILLSSVQWTTGFRADLAAFSDLARSRDLILVVDAIQQLGAMPLDVSRTPVDFLVSGGHKWLNAPAGRGFLYVHPRMVERFTPPAWGYLNIREPDVGWATYFATPTIPAVRDYEFTPTARRFEVGGTANYPGNVVLGASLALLNEVGSAAIEAHIRELTGLLVQELQAAGATIVTPLEPEARSGIITFTLGCGAARDTACLEYLRQRRIFISQRYTAGVGGLRVSVHLFNNSEDVGQLARSVKEERL
jgi:selenocysteine lyase/cysteine desulfurase